MLWRLFRVGFAFGSCREYPSQLFVVRFGELVVFCWLRCSMRLAALVVDDARVGTRGKQQADGILHNVVALHSEAFLGTKLGH